MFKIISLGFHSYVYHKQNIIKYKGFTVSFAHYLQGNSFTLSLPQGTIFVCPMVRRLVFGSWPPLNRGFTITLRHTPLGRTPERVINPTQRPLADSTQHSKETDVYFRRRIRFRNNNKRAVADLRSAHEVHRAA
jgi:hypothetical protein